MAIAMVLPASMVSRPMSLHSCVISAMQSRSLMPQFAPMAQTVSYSRQETCVAVFIRVDAGAFDDAAGMAAVVCRALAFPAGQRFSMTSAIARRRSLAAPSNWPALKLRVGRPPASFRMLIRTAVPNAFSPPPFFVRPCSWIASVSFLRPA